MRTKNKQNSDSIFKLCHRLFFYSLTAVLLIGSSSCKIGKYLPEGEYLLKDATVKVIAADSVKTEAVRTASEAVLDTRVSPRWRVWWHYRDGFLLRWLGQRIGREPIFYDTKQAELTEEVLVNRAVNLGHFYTQTNFSTDTLANQSAIRVNYELNVGARYRLDTLIYYFPDSLLARQIDSLTDKSLLKVDRPYSLNDLLAERERIAEALRKRGLYYFNANQLDFLADTISQKNGVRLLLKLKDDVAPQSVTAQRIANVSVTIGRSSNQDEQATTTTFEGLAITCQDCPLRTEILAQAIDFRRGQLYHPEQHERTTERLASFNTFRYISINYAANPTADSLLDVNILLTPALRRSASGEVGAAYNSGRYFGPELSVQYQNRNLLRGAELFTLQGDVVYNFFLGPAAESRIPRSGIFGLEAQLQIPRFFLPKVNRILPGLREASTFFSLGTRVENIQLRLDKFRQEIEQNQFATLAELLTQDDAAQEAVNLWQFSLDYGYRWKRQSAFTHRLIVARIRFQNPRVPTEELLSLSRSLGFTQGLSGLGRLDRMFLIGPNYEWIYDSRLASRKRIRRSAHQFLINAQIGLGFNTVLPVGENQRELAREQSNYLRPLLDSRYYWQFARAFTLASRVHLGAVLPFTQRAIVPYFDLFTVGGPNSLRGFLPRGLGPGVTVPLDNNLLGQNGFGNILIESSLELRWKMTDLFQLAAFTDAGNVWLYKTETEPTLGDFDLERFRQELAVNVGAGLRIDLSFLLLRLDVAFPVRIPYEQVTDNPDRRARFVIGFGQAF